MRVRSFLKKTGTPRTLAQLQEMPFIALLTQAPGASTLNLKISGSNVPFVPRTVIKTNSIGLVRELAVEQEPGWLHCQMPWVEIKWSVCCSYTNHKAFRHIFYCHKNSGYQQKRGPLLNMFKRILFTLNFNSSLMYAFQLKHQPW